MDKIETALKEVQNISSLCKVLAKEFEMEASSVKVNWIYGGSIPKKHQAKALKIILRENNKQKATA